MGMPRYLPWREGGGGGCSLTLPCSRLWVGYSSLPPESSAVLWCKASGMSLRSACGGGGGEALMDYYTPSAASHVNIPLMWPSQGLGFTDGPVSVREDGCLVPLTRGYTTHLKPLPPPHFRGRL